MFLCHTWRSTYIRENERKERRKGDRATETKGGKTTKTIRRKKCVSAGRRKEGRQRDQWNISVSLHIVCAVNSSTLSGFCPSTAYSLTSFRKRSAFTDLGTQRESGQLTLIRDLQASIWPLAPIIIFIIITFLIHYEFLPGRMFKNFAERSCAIRLS